MLDSTTYYLAYFYPRVAVYDDYNGWDTMDFTDAQEFYSDFNDYDVTVQRPGELHRLGHRHAAQPRRRAAAGASRSGSQASLTSDQIDPRRDARRATRRSASPRRTATNAWHFTATNIPDMTFALSDHYDWDAASVVVDDATHRRASVQAAFNDTAADFHHMVQFGRHALDWLSHNWPGVPYPYEKTTIVQGSAGMEYPMMVNDESDAGHDVLAASSSSTRSRTRTSRSTWGSTRRATRFMDEGWATTFEYLIGIADMGRGEGRRLLQAVPRRRLDPRSVAAGRSADHHAGRRAQGRGLRQQRLRQGRRSATSR